MTQENNLKEGIIAAVVEQLQSFKTEIIATIDGKFAAQDTVIETRFQEQDSRIEARFRKQDTYIETRFREQGVHIETRFREQDAHIDAEFRQQGVILEDIQDTVKMIAEGQEFLYDKIDGLDRRVTILEQRQI